MILSYAPALERAPIPQGRAGRDTPPDRSLLERAGEWLPAPDSARATGVDDSGAGTAASRRAGEAGGASGRDALARDTRPASRSSPSRRAAPLVSQDHPPLQARRQGPSVTRPGPPAATTAEEGGTIGCRHASRGPRPCDSASAVPASGSSSPPPRSFFARSSRRIGGRAAWSADQPCRSDASDGRLMPTPDEMGQEWLEWQIRRVAYRVAMLEVPLTTQAQEGRPHA
jgi:hypothetical protein